MHAFFLNFGNSYLLNKTLTLILIVIRNEIEILSSYNRKLEIKRYSAIEMSSFIDL